MTDSWKSCMIVVVVASITSLVVTLYSRSSASEKTVKTQELLIIGPEGAPIARFGVNEQDPSSAELTIADPIDPEDTVFEVRTLNEKTHLRLAFSSPVEPRDKAYIELDASGAPVGPGRYLLGTSQEFYFRDYRPGEGFRDNPLAIINCASPRSGEITLYDYLLKKYARLTAKDESGSLTMKFQDTDDSGGTETDNKPAR